MRRLLLIAVLALTTSVCFALQATKIAYGDELRFDVFGHKDLSGEFKVLTDGAIYTPGTGRLPVLGKTVEEARAAALKALRKILRDPSVTIVFVKQKDLVVYVVGGTKTTPGQIPLAPNMDLRSVVAQAGLEKEDDLFEISVFRKGVKAATVDGITLAKDQNAWNGPMEAEDVVVIQQKGFLRVWIGGEVKNPGQVKIPEGSDLYQAIAAAGDLTSNVNSKLARDQYKLTVRRGEQTTVFAANDALAQSQFKLEPGDTIMLMPPTRRRVLVTGEVKIPGEYSLIEGDSILNALEVAGGVSQEGSISSVFLIRDSKVRIFRGDGIQSRTILSAEKVKADDSIFVPKNERAFYVFGVARQPGWYLMQDGRSYRLADSLAAAGGLAQGGSLRQVTILRYDAQGKATTTHFNLDEFLKKGDGAQNPAVEANDFIFFGEPKGLTIGDAISGLSTLFILRSFFR